MNALGSDEAVVLGGTSAIGKDVYESIDALVSEISRCGGKDRYDTSLAVCRTYMNRFSGDTVSFATGKNYPDALAGGVFAAKQGAPVVLVDNSANIASVQSFIKDLAPSSGYVFGGTSVLDDTLVGKITK